MGKYEEALARARQGKPIDEIFPELKESEDERIRKGLIEIFNSALGQDFLQRKAGLDRDKVIAYLEKQKEEKGQNEGHKIVEYPAKCAPEVTVSDDERAKEDERILEWIIGIVNACKTLSFKDKVKLTRYLEKQKEHHYTKRNDLFDKCVENCDSATMKEVSDNVDAILQKEQKPAEWSEADKYKVAVYLHDKAGGMVWSKAEEMTSEILDILRPQPHWKPSEEQMIALYKAAQESPIIKENGNYLYDLYDDLRKLM